MSHSTPTEFAGSPKQKLKTWSSMATGWTSQVLLYQILSLVGWLLLAFGIGRAVGQASIGDVRPEILMIAVAGLILRVAGVWAAEMAAVQAGHEMKMAARGDILSSLNSAGASWLGGAAPGARVSQIIDRTEKLSGYAANFKPGMRMAVLGPVVILSVVATQSWLSAVLLAVSVLVLPIFIWLTAMQTASEAKAQQAALDDLSGAFQVRAAQAGLIRAFRAISRETNRLAQASNALRIHTMSVLRVAFLSTAVLEFFASVSIALVAVYVGFKLLGVFPFGTFETITLSEGLTILILAPEFFAPIRRLSSLHHDRSDAKAASEFLAPWLAQAESAKVEKLPALSEAPTIRFQDVSLGWQSVDESIGPFNLNAEPGQITVVSGPSGSGKTSLLHALIGQTILRSGETLIGSEQLQAHQSISNSVAYIGQTPWLMEGSVRENLLLARPDASEAELKGAASAVGLFDMLDHGRQGLDTLLARFGAGLSGGQRQRIAFARALLRQSPIWLLDEPTAHLDPDAELDFIFRLQSMKSGRTVLVASHASALVKAADNLIELSALSGGHTE